MAAKSFSILPGFQAESFTPKGLELLAAKLRQHNISEVQFTGSKRIRLLEPTQEAVTALTTELQTLSTHESNNGITYIQACPGLGFCKYGIRDAQLMQEAIESTEFSFTVHAKVKIGIAGCSMCCTEPLVRDIGLLADQKGWRLFFGGNAGSRPRIGDLIAENLSEHDVLELIVQCLTVYQEYGQPKLRTARFLEKFGVDRFKKLVCK